ncbi:MAG TPA: tetraacyldisaccharide 4'-kinase, partial [Vicinamibacterales bacterium]|nr:tetraacyldisaccharide 4'-kinase [Vicinamibacterales bacterium]
ERFFGDLISVGWELVGSMTFADHHRFTRRDIARIATAAKTSSAAIVLTTEKDAVRLAACDLDDLPIASVPLEVGLEPADAFRDWLIERLRTACSTAAPGTAAPSASAPSTSAPGTSAPSTSAPSTQHPSTQHPSTPAPDQ